MMAYLYYQDRTAVVYGLTGLRGVRPMAIRVFRPTAEEERCVMAYHGCHPTCLFINFELYPDEEETKRLSQRGNRQFTPNDALAFAANILGSDFKPRESFIPKGAVINGALIGAGTINTGAKQPEKTAATIMADILQAASLLGDVERQALASRLRGSGKSRLREIYAAGRPALQPFVIFDEMTDYKPADWAAVQALVGNPVGAGLSYTLQGRLGEGILDTWYKDGLQKMDAKTFREQYECTFVEPEPTEKERDKAYKEWQKAERAKTSARPVHKRQPWKLI
jgi:hypothetical protein